MAYFRALFGLSLDYIKPIETIGGKGLYLLQSKSPKFSTLLHKVGREGKRKRERAAAWIGLYDRHKKESPAGGQG
jgi:hypothetical protein